MNIGEMIKFYRLKKGLTQAQLSQLTDISLSSIKQYEIGKIKPKHEQLSKIAKALSISEVVFYEFNLDTVGEVVSLLFLMDDAVDIEIIGEKDKLEEKYLPDTVSLKFKNPYLRKFMADWALMKEYLNNVDDDIKKIKNPESEWVIFENTHEPIWTEAIAEAVKQARQSRRRPTKMGEMGMFSGMMYCADCGSILYQCRATGFRNDQEYYICSGYRKGKQVCGTPHSIRTVILEELILQNLREIVSFARSHENRFVQMVMDMDVKERNKGLAKKRKLLSEGEKRITELDMIFKRLYEDNISGKLTDERFHKLSTDYEAEQTGLQTQAAILREEIEEVEGKSANVDRFLSVARQYTDIPELTPRILHEFVEKIVIHAATDPHSKINRRQEVDIYYKGIGILEMSKVFDSR